MAQVDKEIAERLGDLAALQAQYDALAPSIQQEVTTLTHWWTRDIGEVRARYLAGISLRTRYEAEQPYVSGGDVSRIITAYFLGRLTLAPQKRGYMMQAQRPKLNPAKLTPHPSGPCRKCRTTPTINCGSCGMDWCDDCWDTPEHDQYEAEVQAAEIANINRNLGFL